jgi:hypothetical protein
MADPNKPPVVTPIVAAEDALEHDEDTGLPEHELRDTPTAGGGVMSQGGTAIDRGTGTLEGRAQGPKADDDEDDPMQAPADPDEVVPTSHLPG